MMKRLIPIIVLTLSLQSLLWSQTGNSLEGVVVLQNSQTNTGRAQKLSGVEIQLVGSSVKTYTDGNGRFRMVATGFSAGDCVRLMAKKDGYCTANADELLQLTLSSPASPLVILMVDTAAYYQAMKSYYKQLETHIQKQYESRLNGLKSGGHTENQVKTLMSNEQNRLAGDQKEALDAIANERRELLNQYLPTVLNAALKTDLDEASTLHREVFQLAYKNGNIEQAYEKLDWASLNHELSPLIEKKKTLRPNEKENAFGISPPAPVRAVLLKANLSALTGHYHEAIDAFNLALSIDSSNETTVTEYLQFLRAFGYKEQALQLSSALSYEYEGNAVRLAKMDFQDGVTLYQMRKYKEAEGKLVSAVAYLENLAADSPRMYDAPLAAALYRLGATYLETKVDSNTLTSTIREAISLYQQLAIEDPAMFEADLAGALKVLAEYHSKKKQYSAALGLYEQALALEERTSPTKPLTYTLNSINTLYEMGNAYIASQDISNAEWCTNEIVEKHRKLTESNEKLYYAGLAGALTNLGYHHLFETEFLDKAKTNLEEAIVLQRELMHENAKAHFLNMVKMLRIKGYLAYIQRDFPLAEAHYVEAIQHLRNWQGTQKNSEISAEMAFSFNFLGHMYLQEQVLDKSIRYYEEALAISRTLVGKDEKESLRYKYLFSIVLYNLAMAAEQTQQLEKSEALYQEVANLQKMLAEEDSETYGLDYLATLVKMGLLYNKMEDVTRAKEYLLLGLNSYRKLEALSAVKPYRPYSFMWNLIYIGNLELNQFNLDVAETYYQEAITIFNQLKKEAQSLVMEQYGVVNGHLSKLYLQRNQPETAMRYAQEALKTFDGLANENADLYAMNASESLLRLANIQKVFSNYEVAAAQLRDSIPKYAQRLEKLKNKELSNRNQAIFYGGSAEVLLYAQQWQAAEQLAQQGSSSADSISNWVNVELAIAQLMQGKVEDAKLTFNKLKDMPEYKEVAEQWRPSGYSLGLVFMEKLSLLEAAGRIPKERKAVVEKFRKAFKKYAKSVRKA